MKLESRNKKIFACRGKFGGVFLALAAVLVFLFAVWGPEQLAGYKDKTSLNKITVEAVEGENAGYRYTLSNNEKLYILSMCLNNQVLPETELSALTRMESVELDYGELGGTYAFVVNRQGPSEKEITGGEIFDICNREMEKLKELGVMPEEVKGVNSSSYQAELYSAIDVLEPRNNMAVWKVSLSTSQQNANKANRLLDAYIDADTGKIYEFYARTEGSWNEMDPHEMAKQWSGYLGLAGMEAYETENPLLETTPYFEKFRSPGQGEGNTIVTIGFYEGINELFLKIAK